MARLGEEAPNFDYFQATYNDDAYPITLDDEGFYRSAGPKTNQYNDVIVPSRSDLAAFDDDLQADDRSDRLPEATNNIKEGEVIVLNAFVHVLASDDQTEWRLGPSNCIQ